MASERRLLRLQALIQQELGRTLLADIRDPRAAFISVTRVRMARDLRQATVFISVLGDEGDRSKTLHMLEHARGFLQKRIAAVLTTRFIPHLSFKLDDSIARGVEVSGLIDQAMAELEQDQAQSVAEPEGENEPGAEDETPGERPIPN